MSYPRAFVVDSWSCPTWVRAGIGAARSLGEMCDSREIILLTDARLDPSRSPLRECLEGVRVRVHARREPGISDWEFLQQMQDLLATYANAVPVAVGGGSVLDGVRLATLANRKPGLLGRLAGVLAGGGGMLALEGTPNSGGDSISLPTTIGTAAEVSPLAVVRTRTAGAVMVVTPELRSRAAILDPYLTDGLSHAQLVLGLMEPLARALVPAVCGQPLVLQDSLTRALVDAVAQLAEQLTSLTVGQVARTPFPQREAPDWAQWRLAAAQLSAQTHTSFLAVGRSPFGARLWPVATELSGPTLSKAEAMAWLIPAWLRGVAAGVLGAAWGSAARAETVLGEAPASAAGRIAGWLGVAGLNPPHGVRDPEQLAAAVTARWPMFLGTQGVRATVAPAELAWLAAQVGSSDMQ